MEIHEQTGVVLLTVKKQDVVNKKYIDNVFLETMKLKSKKLEVCPKCGKRTLKARFEGDPNWIKDCLCCRYKEVNTKFSPFLY